MASFAAGYLLWCPCPSLCS